jgi:tripartite-type tricarboxylate transporter receptor subunit TctC
VVDKLNAEVRKIIAKPDVKAAWDKQGAVALTMSPQEFDAYLRKDIEKWAAVVKAAKLAK